MNSVSALRGKIAVKNQRLHAFATWCLVLFLAGCAVGPGYRKPTVNAPLYDLLRLMAPASDWVALDAEWRSGGEGKGYGSFKKKLVGYYHANFDAPRRRYAELMADPAEVERILQAGSLKARAYAAPVIQRVRHAVGL